LPPLKLKYPYEIQLILNPQAIDSPAFAGDKHLTSSLSDTGGGVAGGGEARRSPSPAVSVRLSKAVVRQGCPADALTE